MKKVIQKTKIISKKRKKSPAKKISKDNFTSLATELTLSLKNLKLQTKETAQYWSIRLQSEITQLVEDIHLIQGNQKRRHSHELVSLLRRMHNSIQVVNLKPEKGRLKDLKHLHELVKTIRRLANSLDK